MLYLARVLFVSRQENGSPYPGWGECRDPQKDARTGCDSFVPTGFHDAEVNYFVVIIRLLETGYCYRVLFFLSARSFVFSEHNPEIYV